MSTTIYLKVSRNGRLVDLDETPKLATADSSYGIIDTTDASVIVASGEPLTRLSTGTYKYVFTGETGVRYEYSLKYVYGGETTYSVRNVTSGQSITNLLAIGEEGHYTSYSEVLKQLGAEAVELMLEDWEQADSSDVWEAIFVEVDETIDMFIGQRYAPGAYSNPLLKRMATVLAVFLISQRRGNPGLFLARVNKVYETLEGIKDCDFNVQGLRPRGWFNAPSVRGYVMQPNYRFPVRVDKMKSSGRSHGLEMLAYSSYLYSFAF